MIKNTLSLILGSIFCLANLPVAVAWDNLERMELAQALGSVLGSEELCELQFNQGAIQQFIAERVPPSDMQFTSSLMLMTRGTKRQLQELSASSMTAHCAQTERVARNFGLIE